jgi:putative PIN family toxin of toxin-antitoxin system
MQVVIDTCVFVDGMVLAESEARAVLRLIKKNEIKLLVSIPIVDEIVHTLFRLCRERDVDQVKPMLEVSRAMAAATLVIPPKVLRGVVPDDSDDDKFVTCAHFGDAPYIISEDRHLRDISEKVRTQSGKLIKVIRPEHFGTELLHHDERYRRMIR